MREMGSMLLPEIDYGLVPALLGENKVVKELKMEKIRQNLIPTRKLIGISTLHMMVAHCFRCYEKQCCSTKPPGMPPSN